MASTLSRRLRALRKKQGLTQVQLAKLAGVRQATISDWESGKVDVMDATLLHRVCRALGVSLVDLHLMRHAPAIDSTRPTIASSVSSSLLEEFETDARDWLRQCEAEARDDDWNDDDDGSGWAGKRSYGEIREADSLPRGSSGERKAKRASRRDDVEQFAQQVIREAAAARVALARGDGLAVINHLLRAGHSHGAARWILEHKREEQSNGRLGGEAGGLPINNDALVEAFTSRLKQGNAMKRALELAAADIGASMATTTGIRRLKKRGVWGKGGRNR